MTLAHGRRLLSIPGPTTVPDEVLGAMHSPAVDIYAGPLVATTDSCLKDLASIFGTKGKVYIYAANGHGAWEAALANVLSRGDRILVLGSGLFGPAWGEMAQIMGAKAEVLHAPTRRAVDPGAVAERLKRDKAGEIKAVLVVQVDTASSVVNDIAALGRAIRGTGHDALFMVDTIASLATMPFAMDAWGVDVAVAGSQKGLMVPPGLGFNAANDRARERHKRADLVTRYWDWTFREGDEHYMKYCGTPPEHMLFGLRKSLDLILAEGLENVFRRHRLLAEAVRRCVAVWAQGGGLELNVTEPSARSDSVTTVLVKDPRPLVDFCATTCGVTVGVGIGEFSGRAIRIAHMGHTNAPMVLGTLGSIEMGLSATGIPHGKGGLQAAVDYLAGAVSGKAA